MPSINLTDPVNDTPTDASLIAANNQILETLLNGGLDNSNLAVAAALEIHKLAGFPNDPLKFLRGDGAWAATASPVASEIDYKQLTTTLPAITGVSEAASGPVITGNSVTFDGSRVKVEFWCPRVDYGNAPRQVTLVFWRDTTALGWTYYNITNSVETPMAGFVFDTPPAGAHVYKVTAFVGAGSSGVIFKADVGGAGKLVPGFLRVTRA